MDTAKLHNNDGNNSNNDQQGFNEDDNVAFETEDRFMENDGCLIHEQSKYGEIPAIPERGSTAWEPRHYQQLIDQKSAWRHSRMEHCQKGPRNQLFLERGYNIGIVGSLPPQICYSVLLAVLSTKR